MAADEFFIGPMMTAMRQGRMRQRGALSGLAAGAHRQRLL